MANPTRKRVRALRRAPDGSAFQECQKCGVLVAVALADMHGCEVKKEVKRFRGEFRSQISEKQRFQDQPRSPFRFFMERFAETGVSRNQNEVDRKGFETWRNMSKQERLPYVHQAEKVNSEYTKALLQEVKDLSWVNDEADSAEVGKYDKNYEYYLCSNDSGSYESFSSGVGESFYNDDWTRVHPHIILESP